MDRYFVKPDGMLAGQVLVEKPVNPCNLEIIQTGDPLPGPMDRCQWDGVQVVLLPEPLPEIADYRRKLEAHLDAPAKVKGYDSIHTAALRAAFPGPWHDEGVAFATWMDACNAAAYAILAEVEAGQRPQPTLAEFLAALPALELP